MLAPLSWLRDYAPFDQPVDTIVAALSGLGLVVEGVDRVNVDIPHVLVARILDIRPHPDADRIRLVDVDAGEGETLQVACGAWNMEVGDLVPLAAIGAVLPNGMEIARRKMRGQWSNGMLCAPEEIGLPAGSGGLLILPPGLAPPGTPISAALGGPDVVVDIEVSPNRPDALSMAGVSRDLAAALGVPWAWPDSDPGGAGSRPVAVDRGVASARVTVDAPELCGRFTATVLTGLTVGPSPSWLARRLTLAGMRPINVVVDVSNYVMLDVGQPNHAYDLDRLGGGGLLVRRAVDGETLVTLDGVTRTFGPDDLFICDADSVPVGAAGIMGGADSEISDATTSVLLEAAWFEPGAVARTGIRLGLTSEARHRFERGVDPEIAPRAVARFAQLLAVASGPSLRLGPTLDVRSDADLPPRRVVTLRTARVNAVLGSDLDDATVAGLLRPIGFEVASAQPGVAEVVVPTWRPDSTREIDVIEEVARHHGYPRIARRVPGGARRGGLTAFQQDRRRVRDVLAGAGLDEAWTTTFLAPEDLERAGSATPAVAVRNPLDRAESVLRTELLPGLLKAARFNADRQQPDAGLWEIGRVFAPPAPDAGPVPAESERLGVILTGAGADAAAAVRIWTVLAGAFAVDGLTLSAGAHPGMHPSRTALIGPEGGEPIGAVGEVDPEVATAYGLSSRVGYLSVDLEAFAAQPRRPKRYRPVSRYPASDLDLAFVVPAAVPAAAVATTLRLASGELLEDLALFDVYRDERLGDDHRSLAFRLRLRAADRTLDDAELAGARQQAIDGVVAAHGAELRG
jgi:phenylalanyl-tRNA synthetase beta chain